MANHIKKHEAHFGFQHPRAVIKKLPSLVSADDAKILQQIQSSHAHDACEVDVKPILDVIQDIFNRAAAATLGDVSASWTEDLADKLEAKVGGVDAAAGPRGAMFGALAPTIQEVCCEFCCKCTGGDAHSSTMAILKMLGNYSWDAKVVISLAAFAVTYGELWLVILLSHINPLAGAIAVLKQIPDMSEVKSKLESLNEVIKVMVMVADKLTEFRQLDSAYISPEDPALANSINHISLATYWTVRSIVVSGARIAAYFGSDGGAGSGGTEAWELSSLAHKLTYLHSQLEHRFQLCRDVIVRNRREEEYKKLVELFMATHKDNQRILKALINAKNEIQPLVQVSLNMQVDIDVLRSKTTLLFISDLDVSEEELIFLDMMYKESRQRKNELQYEIVWLAVVDTVDEKKFAELQLRMPWYTLRRPILRDAATERYIKEKWGFAKKPMIVSLDPVAKVVSENAFHMMLIWGNLAYPFTTTKEEELWSKQAWNRDFVLGAILPEFAKWITQGDTNICLFGGEDMDWIRKFTISMKDHATKIGLKLELIYAGKHNAKEVVKRVTTMIKSERLGHTLADHTKVWYFWTRLESMLFSKMHRGKNMGNDTIGKELMSLLSFDGGDQVWGFIASGSQTERPVTAKGDMILTCLAKFKEWEELFKQNGFLAALLEIINKSRSPLHCNRLVLPYDESADVPRMVACADCHRDMEKFVMFKCCTGK